MPLFFLSSFTEPVCFLREAFSFYLHVKLLAEYLEGARTSTTKQEWWFKILLITLINCELEEASKGRWRDSSAVQLVLFQERIRGKACRGGEFVWMCDNYCKSSSSHSAEAQAPTVYIFKYLCMSAKQQLSPWNSHFLKLFINEQLYHITF